MIPKEHVYKAIIFAEHLTLILCAILYLNFKEFIYMVLIEVLLLSIMATIIVLRQRNK
jgi:hypothetical protein